MLTVDRLNLSGVVKMGRARSFQAVRVQIMVDLFGTCNSLRRIRDADMRIDLWHD